MENTIINEKYLKKYSPIPLNFNSDEVANYVKIAEQIWIEPVLGTPLYEQILEQIKSNEVSDENSTLLVEAVYPYLAYAVAYEAMPLLWANISEVGITTGKTDNSESVDLKGLNYIQDHLRRQVEVRKDLAIKWLNEHSDSFPLYYPDCNISCSDNGKLNHPNPYLNIYKPRKIDFGLK